MPSYSDNTKLAAPIPADNPMLQLSQMLERTKLLCTRVDTLCERMLGSSPLNEPQAQLDAAANPFGGVVGGIVTDTRSVNEKLDYAEQALSRIEQVVGPF